jgi:peptidoglycan hydrolase-like protein with peptidoglycan-binding domain
MNRLVKKIVATATVLTMLAGPAMGATVEELQAQIDALLAQLATLQSELAALQGEPTVTGCTITSFDRNLSQGMSGDDVKCLQIILNSSSDTQLAESGVGSSGNETNYFGPLTKAAVIKFQEKYAEDVLASWGLTAGTGYVGSTTRAKLNEILGAGEVPGPVVPAAGLSVALAADTPAAASAPTSTSVLFTKINFTAAAEGDVIVTAVTVTRTGLGADTDVTSVTLYDGSDKLGSTRSSFNSLHQMKFNIPGGWTIPAGETKVLSIRGELAQAGTYNALGIASASHISSDASEVTGGFPIYGNQLTGVTVTIGKVTVDGEVLGTQTKKIGTDDVILASFSLEASSVEDLEFESITLKNRGTASDADIANVYLMKGTDALAGPVSMVRDYVTFVLDEPYLIEKSDKVVFKVVGDIESGDLRTVWFILKNDIDLVCTGQTYGYTAAVDGSGFDVQGETKTTNIVGAQLNFNLVSSVQETPDEVNNFVFATLELTAAAEDTRITNLIITINETDGNATSNDNLDVDELELVDTADGSAFAGTMSDGGDNDADNETWTFDDEIYLTEGVKRSLEIRGDLPSGIGDGDQYNVAMTCDTTNVEAEGVESGDAIDDFSVTSLTGKKVTVKTAALIIASLPMMPGDAVIDATDVVLFEGRLIAGPASAITVDRMKFEQDAATHFDIENISRAVLYTAAGEEQVLTYSDLSAEVADFSSLSIVVPAGSANAIEFGVKVDIKHTISASTTVHIQLDTVSARDEDGDSVSAKSSGLVPIANGTELATDREITLHGEGILKVEMMPNASGVNKDRYVLGDKDTSWIGKIKVRAENEAVLVKDLCLTNANATSDDSDQAIFLYPEDKTAPIGATDLSGALAYFDDINYEVALGTEYLYIKADLRKIGTGASDTADSDDDLQFLINATTSPGLGIVAEGVESGAALTINADGTVSDGEIVYYVSGTISTSTTATTKEFTVVGDRINEIGLVSSAGGKSLASSLSDGSNNVAILKVVTDATTNTDNEGTLLKTILSQIKLDVSKTASTVVNGMTIERIGGSTGAVTMTTTTLGAGNTSGTATTTSGDLGIDAKIGSGDTAYYLVKADLTLDAGTRDAITVDLSTLDAGDMTANVVWKDGDATHPDGGSATTFYKLRLDDTSVDGIKILEPYT